jgi:hypothetical protein
MPVGNFNPNGLQRIKIFPNKKLRFFGFRLPLELCVVIVALHT